MISRRRTHLHPLGEELCAQRLELLQAVCPEIFVSASVRLPVPATSGSRRPGPAAALRPHVGEVVGRGIASPAAVLTPGPVVILMKVLLDVCAAPRGRAQSARQCRS